MPTKPFWQSGTLQGVLTLLIASVAQQLGAGPEAAKLAPAFATVLNTATPFVLACVQFIGLVMAIVGRFNAHKTQITLMPTKALPTGVTKALVLFALLPLPLILGGCAGTAIPSQFQNLTPPLSSADTKIVEGLATFDSPDALLSIRTGAGTLTSISMYEGIKQASTMGNDGMLLYGAGQQLQAFTTGSVGSLSSVDDILTGVKANASTTQSVTNILAIGDGIDGLLATAKTYITNAATSASNPNVAAYALTVFSDDVHAAGAGICDVTTQYVPSTALDVPPFRLMTASTLYADVP